MNRVQAAAEVILRDSPGYHFVSINIGSFDAAYTGIVYLDLLKSNPAPDTSSLEVFDSKIGGLCLLMSAGGTHTRTLTNGDPE